MKFGTGKKCAYSRMVATVFVLGWAACPMAFAAERGKQEGKRVVREVLTRAVGVEQADSLLDQLRAMNIGSFSKVGNTAVLGLSGITLVFDQMARNMNGGISGFVAVYDSTGVKVADYDVSNVASPDPNRFDYSIAASTSEGDWVEEGVLVGVQGNPGNALALRSVDGGDSHASLVNFSGFDTSDSQVAVAPSVTVTQFPDSQGGVAITGAEVCLVTGCAVVVVAVIVVLACLLISALGSLWSCW